MKKKITKQKKITRDFFNKVSSEWHERTYDPKRIYLKFPVNRLRKDVALTEIKNLKIRKGSEMLDIGCGTGQMVIELLGMRYRSRGIDIASKMVKKAEGYFRESGLKKPAYDIFRVMDLVELASSQDKYNVVTALGLLEYLDNDEELFKSLKKIVKKGGYALVECRNKLFNLYSANTYTAKSSKKGEFLGLIDELVSVDAFSPILSKDIPKVLTKVEKEVSKFLAMSVGNKKWNKKSIPRYTNYPKEMLRRQHTPKDLSKIAGKYGFELKYVSYYHLHPYLPRYEKLFPQIYNRISELTTPLGRTSIGALTGSAFIGILVKK